MKTAVAHRAYPEVGRSTNGRVHYLHAAVAEEPVSIPHPLTPLLAPRSIALVGASETLNTPGNDMLHELRVSRYKGEIWPVNPKYEEIEDWTCYPSLSDLPFAPDLAVLAVGNHHLEALMGEAIRIGVKGLVIFGSAQLPGDTGHDTLQNRIQHLAIDAGVPIVGPNCMGYYNVEEGVRAFPFHLPRSLGDGGITFIAQSGSVLTSLLWNERKLAFNLAISPGNELVTTVADYMDYALDLPSTKVIAMFLEAVRDPGGFVAALEKAQARGVPVVLIKVGRSVAAAALAMSHSGAMAGNDDAYEALFRRYGVIRVSSIDELASTALLFAQGRRPGPGGLAAILDSGGEREILLDLADQLNVPMANINHNTVQVLKDNLDHGLEPINPLDAWGTGNHYDVIYENCWQALMEDPDTAVGLFIADLTSGFYLHESFAHICRRVKMRVKKPMAIMTNHVGSEHQDLAIRMTQAGLPVLDGTQPGLLAVMHLLEYRDFQARPQYDLPESIDPAIVQHWRDRLDRVDRPLGEFEALSLLSDYGIAVPQMQVVEHRDEAVAAAETIGYPVVLKTAMPGIFHKTDVGGVKLNLHNRSEVIEAYDELAAALGPMVLVSRMARGEVELAFGLLNDRQFGPLVMVAGGGVFIEMLKDRQVALAPMDLGAAHRCINALKSRPMLNGFRGKPPCDLNALARALCQFSQLADDLGDRINELDVNPVKVSAQGCVAVDALVTPRQFRS
ncbi:acetate--CoA ligase family protein [Candidatus Entotheonella palauensis]|uniref:acetate--CoA ligase family protein n=1 Tax=Candidatus Entotheonella palauensis TaxID=93172 RepID=UPI000B7D6BB6|nr:acetate--CoA ligase family protein [Candidatus Entotheonella palauensis]